MMIIMNEVTLIYSCPSASILSLHDSTLKFHFGYFKYFWLGLLYFSMVNLSSWIFIFINKKGLHEISFSWCHPLLIHEGGSCTINFLVLDQVPKHIKGMPQTHQEAITWKISLAPNQVPKHIKGKPQTHQRDISHILSPNLIPFS